MSGFGFAPSIAVFFEYAKSRRMIKGELKVAEVLMLRGRYQPTMQKPAPTVEKATSQYAEKRVRLLVIGFD